MKSLHTVNATMHRQPSERIVFAHVEKKRCVCSCYIERQPGGATCKHNESHTPKVIEQGAGNRGGVTAGRPPKHHQAAPAAIGGVHPAEITGGQSAINRGEVRGRDVWHTGHNEERAAQDNCKGRRLHGACRLALMASGSDPMCCSHLVSLIHVEAWEWRAGGTGVPTRGFTSYDMRYWPLCENGNGKHVMPMGLNIASRAPLPQHGS